MPFAILIAATLSFGRISTDLTAVVAALNNTINSLHNKSYRIVVTDEPDKPDLLHKAKSTYTHAVTEMGHYYARENHPFALDVTCFSRDHSFDVLSAKNGWLLSRILKRSDEDARYQSFSWEAFARLFCFIQQPISHFAPSPFYQTCAIYTAPNRMVIWGRYTHESSDGNITAFRAAIRFFDSRRKAYFEETEYEFRSQKICFKSKTKSNVCIDGDSLVFLSGVEDRTYYPEGLTEEEIRKCKNTSTTRIRTEANTDVTISENQLTPEYYGFDRRTMHQVLTAQFSTPKPSPSSGSYDLLLAILIPVGLIGLLYLVIRKT